MFQRSSNNGGKLVPASRPRFTKEDWDRLEKLLGFLFGIAFLAIIAYRAFLPGDIPARQFVLFRILIAISGAGFLAFLTGFLTVETGTNLHYIRAGGALAGFCVLFFWSPPPPPPLDPQKTKAVEGIHSFIEVIRVECNRFEREYPEKYKQGLSAGKTPEEVKQELFQESKDNIDRGCRKHRIGLDPKTAFKDKSAEEWSQIMSQVQKRFVSYQELVHQLTVEGEGESIGNRELIRGSRQRVLQELKGLRDLYSQRLG